MFRRKIIGWVMTLPFLFSSCPAPTLLLPYMGFRKSIPWPDRISAWRVAGQLAGTSPKVLDLWWRNLWNAPNILKNPCKSMNPTAMAHNNRGHTPISNHWGNGPSPQPRGGPSWTSSAQLWKLSPSFHRSAWSTGRPQGILCRDLAHDFGA